MEQAPVAAAPEQTRRGAAGVAASVGGALRHPLLLLLVGAMFSALLVPMLTQRWQDHQRALDVQTVLVGDVTEASTEHLWKLYSLRGAHDPASNTARSTAVEKWQVKFAVIESRLRAYYPGTAIPKEWANLGTSLEYMLLAAETSPKYDLLLGGQKWDRSFWQSVGVTYAPLLGRLFSGGSPNWRLALIDVGLQRDQLVQRVLDTTPRV